MEERSYGAPPDDDAGDRGRSGNSRSATRAVRHWRAWLEKREYDKALSNYDNFIRVYPNDIVDYIRRAAAFVLMLSFWRRILFGAIALGAAVGFVSWVLGVI
jgi:hypothetical protein